MRRAALAALAVARIVAADPESDADLAFHAAELRAAAGDPGAIGALEQLGAARPATRWTDDAWAEAARLAERAGDLGRARRDLAQAIATATDDSLRRRATADLERLEAIAGAGGQWTAVATEHDRLAARIAAGGDPRPALGELEALLRASPGYPRAATAMIAIARGWERDGDRARALTWLREAAAAPAPPADHERAVGELARCEIRAGEFDDARAQIAAADRLDPPLAATLRDDLATAEHRAELRWLLWAVLAAIAAAAALALRRAAGSWCAAARRLARPPAEVVFFVPIAVVLAIVASTGNPLVASAVRAIALVGASVGWLSGAILDGVRARTGKVRASRAAVHAAIAAVAVVAATYLAIDRDRMIDLVAETWRSGPAMR